MSGWSGPSVICRRTGGARAEAFAILLINGAFPTHAKCWRWLSSMTETALVQCKILATDRWDQQATGLGKSISRCIMI